MYRGSLLYFKFSVPSDICWERLKGKGERGSRGWNGYIVSLTQWKQVWGNSRRQWRTRKPGMLQSMRSQRVRHNLVIEHHHQQITYDTEPLFICSPFVYTSFLMSFPFRSFPHILIGPFSYCWVLRVLCILCIQGFHQMVFFKYFLPICGLSFHSLNILTLFTPAFSHLILPVFVELYCILLRNPRLRETNGLAKWWN